MIRSAWFPLLLGALTLTACGNGEDLVIAEPDPSPTPTLQLVLDQPTSVAANVGIPQGASGGATVTRSTGFNGAVTMSAVGVPTGWSVAFSPAVLDADVNATNILITAPANVVAGSYSFTVRATVIGVTSAGGGMTVTANVVQNN